MCLCLLRSERAQQHAAQFIFLTDNLHLHSSQERTTKEKNVCGVCAFPVWNFMDFLVFSFSKWKKINENWKKLAEKIETKSYTAAPQMNCIYTQWNLCDSSWFFFIFELVPHNIYVYFIYFIEFFFYSKLHSVHTMRTNVRLLAYVECVRTTANDVHRFVIRIQ